MTTCGVDWDGFYEWTSRYSMSPKLINGKVWVPLNGGYCPLSPDDPKYNEILLWIDSQRFVELLDWIYKRRNNVTGQAANLNPPSRRK